MNAPRAPKRGTDQRLYGFPTRSAKVNRRALIVGVAALPMLGLLGGTTNTPAPRRVRLLQWDGRAALTIGGRQLALAVRTQVEPFVAARSVSWIVGRGSWTAATMSITQSTGTVQRNGADDVLPVSQAIHERQQYGLYGHMLLAQEQAQPGQTTLHTEHPGFPPADFTLDGHGRLLSAEYKVAAPSGTGSLVQHIVFGGTAPGSDWWPATITLSSTEMVFALTIDAFARELA